MVHPSARRGSVTSRIPHCHNPLQEEVYPTHGYDIEYKGIPGEWITNSIAFIDPDHASAYANDEVPVWVNMRIKKL